MDSLTLLASLQPRAPATSEPEQTPPPLIPPLSVVRALHATLPIGATQGWQGTLDESRKTALRDDTTVHVKSGAPQAVAQNTAATQAYNAPGSFAQNNQYRPQATYPFPNSQTQQRPSAQTQTSSQSSYYPNAYLQGQTPGTLAQYPYTYPPSWYNYQAQPQSAQKSGGGAPFYANYMPSTGTPRAVGNTAKPHAQQNGWAQGYGQGQAAATLPPHLRRGAGTSTPGAQTPTQSYPPYHTYVPPAQAQSGR
jgi:hypothetical protein